MISKNLMASHVISVFMLIIWVRKDFCCLQNAVQFFPQRNAFGTDFGANVDCLETNKSVHVENFDVQVFNSLRHFDEAKHYEEHLHVGKLLASLIDKHGLYSKVTVQVLHKHFDLEDHEILAETIQGNVSKIVPTSKNLAQRRLAYMWRFRIDPSEIVHLQPLEYLMEPDKVVSDAYSDLLKEEQFLIEFAATLNAYHASNVFGLGLQHRSHIAGDSLETPLFPDCNLRGLKVQTMLEKRAEMTSVCIGAPREEDC